MARPSRTALYADDRFFLWKAILRFLAILCALVGVATIGWALAHRLIPEGSNIDPNDTEDYYYDGGFGDDPYDFVTLPWSFIGLGLSILWNAANLIVLAFRNRPIHPGANVGCDLILWLGLIVTGLAAVSGALNYFAYYPGEYDNGNNSGDSYGTFSNSSGTWYTLPDGSLANQTIAHDCGGFSTCATQQQFESSIRHKGVIIVVGAAMNFILVLMHFALFISACRYTHARRYGVGSKHAKAITAEATQIAQQMIADMTGPNGTFRPRSQQRQAESQPLMGGSSGGDGTGGQRDLQQMEENDHHQQETLDEPIRHQSPQSSILDLPPPDLPQRRYDDHATTPVWPLHGGAGAESSAAGTAAANRTLPEIRLEGPEGVHPALRRERAEREIGA